MVGRISTVVELGRCRYFRSVSVIGIGIGIFIPTITIRHVLKNRHPSFPSLLVPYHARVSKRSATLVLLDCLCMDFGREYIHANLIIS